MNYHGSRNGLMIDYCDGEKFKQNRLFIEDPCALQIQLYYDELEVCYPLGSFAKKHKLGMCSINSKLIRLNEKANIVRMFVLYSR